MQNGYFFYKTDMFVEGRLCVVRGTWYGVVYWCSVVYWCGMVWYGMVWYGMVWYGMVYYGMEYTAGHDVVWCDFL